MDGGGKKEKVTTFKLTEDLTKALDAIKHRDGCTKDAAIRRMIILGLEPAASVPLALPEPGRHRPDRLRELPQTGLAARLYGRQDHERPLERLAAHVRLRSHDAGPF